LKIMFERIATVILLVLASAYAQLAMAKDLPSPSPQAMPSSAVLSRPAVVSYAEMKKLVAEGKTLILDVNGEADFDAGHIKGAVSYIKFKSEIKNKLPKNLDAMIVIYAPGPASPRWEEPTIILREYGYTNLKYFEGGLKEWKAKGGKLVTR